MSKSWEIKLTNNELYKFRQILKDLRNRGGSFFCPFDSSTCNRSKPTCAVFIKGLKRIDHSSKTACPCYKFRTASLIWRIERLLKYNKLFIRHKHISIHPISKGRNKNAT